MIYSPAFSHKFCNFLSQKSQGDSHHHTTALWINIAQEFLISEFILNGRTAACPCTRSIDRFPCERQQLTRALVSPVPIKTPERPSRLSGQTRILFTQPCVTTQFKRISRTIVQKAVLFQLHFPVSLICILPSCHFGLERSRHGWGVVCKTN